MLCFNNQSFHGAKLKYMKGICFKENMFNQILYGEKIQTRRLVKDKPPKYKVGETLFLKEPYQFNYHLVQQSISYEPTSEDIVYKFLKNTSTSEMLEEKWENKLFMPEKFARYFIKITAVKKEKLHDISEIDAIKEGIEFSRPIPFGYKNYITPSNYFDKTKMYQVDDTFKPEYSGAVMSFLSLWEKINKGNVFNENPDVYAYSFEILH